jgi:hypothetical protein
LNWLSAIEANYLKNYTPSKSLKSNSELEENPQPEKPDLSDNPNFSNDAAKNEKL